MNEFLKVILGNQTLAGFAGNMVLAIVGILVKLQWDANKRDPNSPTTPVNFSLGFLLKDNALRLFSSFAFSLFIVYIAVRFTDQLLHVQLNPFVALLIGLASDSIASLLKNLTKDITAFTPVQTTATTATGEKTVIDPDKPAAEQVDIKDQTTIATTSVADTAESKANNKPERVSEPWEIEAQKQQAQPAVFFPNAEQNKNNAISAPSVTVTYDPTFNTTSPLPNASSMGNTIQSN